MPQEVTQLNPLQEALFKKWLVDNGITDANNPQAFYDYRGYFQSTKGQPHQSGTHFPDTFKQHGHPTFSIESRYSKGPFDGGMWAGENYLPQMQPAISHEQKR